MEKLKEGIPGFGAMIAMIDKANNVGVANRKTTDNRQTANNTSLQVTTKRI